jgi:hypothetical protein
VTMYVSDDSVDAAIAKQPKIQDAVRGKSIMLFPPGHAVSVAVNACLTIGYMGTALSVYLTWPIESFTMLIYLIAAVGMAVALGSVAFSLLRGFSSARRIMYRFSVALALLGGIAATVTLTRFDTLASGLAIGGVALSVAANRLIAGEGYALFSAFFRAKRAFELNEQGRGVRRS